MNKLYFDGKITESINDFDLFNRGFKYNDSFFETIHVTNGKVFNVKNGEDFGKHPYDKTGKSTYKRYY